MFEQERMVGRLQRKVLAEADIKACFLSGSFGKRSEDDYSDIDVALVYIDENKKALAWENRRQFVQSIMPYLAVKSFDAAHVRPFFHIALYANGSKLDFRYESIDSLAPNPWDSQIRILKDEQNWADNFQKSSAQLAYPRPYITTAELLEIDRRFWIMYWDIIRQIARGDSKRPYPVYLEMLYFTFPTLLASLPEGHNARDALINIRYDINAKDSIQWLNQLIHLYIDAREAAVNFHSLQFTANNAFESEILKLLAKLS